MVILQKKSLLDEISSTNLFVLFVKRFLILMYVIKNLTKKAFENCGSILFKMIILHKKFLFNISSNFCKRLKIRNLPFLICNNLRKSIYFNTFLHTGRRGVKRVWITGMSNAQTFRQNFESWLVSLSKLMPRIIYPILSFWFLLYDTKVL